MAWQAIAAQVGQKLAEEYGPKAAEWLADKGGDAGAWLGRKLGLTSDKGKTEAATAIAQKAPFYVTQAYRDQYRPQELRCGVIASGWSPAGQIRSDYKRMKPYSAKRAASVAAEYLQTEGYLRYRQPKGKPGLKPELGMTRRIILIAPDPAAVAKKGLGDRPVMLWRFKRSYRLPPKRGVVEVRAYDPKAPGGLGRLAGMWFFNFTSDRREALARFETKKEAPPTEPGQIPPELATEQARGFPGWIWIAGLAAAFFALRKGR